MQDPIQDAIDDYFKLYGTQSLDKAEVTSLLIVAELRLLNKNLEKVALAIDDLTASK